jgi:hypothetical protein
MSPGRRRRAPPLTLVTSSGVSGARPGPGGDASAAGARDWSQLMARAQDGDRDAYRALLEDITPYLRALAARCFRETGDIEDAVQDVLLTIHAVRHAYDPGRPFGPWLVAIANRRIRIGEVAAGVEVATRRAADMAARRPIGGSPSRSRSRPRGMSMPACACASRRPAPALR